jgi:streptomycin 6-kinase
MIRVPALPLPPNLVDAARQQHREAWLDGLPTRVAELQRRWSLDVGAPFQPGGTTAWVAPVRTADGADLVLKVCWPHSEAADEATGLRVWNGDGAVRLHDVAQLDDAVGLLMERCTPGTTLAQRDQREQDSVITSLLLRLWRELPQGHKFRPLQDMCDAWADEFELKLTDQTPDLDPGLVRAGVELFRALPGSATAAVLLCTDLHAQNVLAAQREPWLMVDPKPYVGDPTYDPLQHLLNCPDRLHADPRGFATRIAGLLGLDGERLCRWLFARCVVESLVWPTLVPVAARLAPK